MSKSKPGAKPKKPVTKSIAKSAKRPRGRPEIQADAEQLKNLCAIGCTQAEIATVCGVSRKTIERWAQRPDLADIFLYGRELGKASIRRQQFKLMDAGSVAMAIWLGKQYLGQKDEVKVEAGADSITYAGLLGIIDRIESKRPAPPE